MVEFGGRSTLEGGGSGAREWEAVGKYSQSYRRGIERRAHVRKRTQRGEKSVKKATGKRGQLAGSVKVDGLELVSGGGP